MRTIFHGIRQRALFDVFQAQVIPLWGMHAETGFDASEAIMTTDLREQQRNELLPARVILRVAVALVLVFELLEFVSRKNLEQLSQNRRNLSHGLKLLLSTAVIVKFRHF
ncbi:hypothetical protein Ptc2401_01676 [Prosthecochloris sp. CIB 2401]|nr:hypothetical protein Ptc2401_01676 [Prosthecochloris sp. CIB 2401]